MPIRKINEFTEAMTEGNILLTGESLAAGEKNAIPELSINYVVMNPGQEVKPHTHRRTEAYIILTGRAMVMCGHDIMEATTGDVVIAPTGTPHAIMVLGNERLRFYAVNSPPAETAPVEPALEEYLWKWKRK
jgi:mannose-6-phosphate isomerase-like protein (cupin superfamily)